MQSAYAVVPAGIPNSSSVVAAPFSHFHTTLSLLSVALFLMSSPDFCAARQPAWMPVPVQDPAPSHVRASHSPSPHGCDHCREHQGCAED
jgi:hypothetical protein